MMRLLCGVAFSFSVDKSSLLRYNTVINKRPLKGNPMKKLLSFVLIAILLITTVLASTKGLLTDSLTWEYTADGTYTIKGTGAFSKDAEPLFPGLYEVENIKTLVFSDGITSISDGLVEKLYALEEVVIPPSVTAIDANAFSLFKERHGFVVICDRASYAEDYCKENSLNYIIGDATGERVAVGLPNFDVTIAGRKYDNVSLAHPLLFYKDVTYLPMTEPNLLPLGMVSFTREDTLFLDSCDKGVSLSVPAISNTDNKKYFTAFVSDVPINVMGVDARPMFLEYPILQYNGCYYLPLSWNVLYESFGIYYTFDHENGLVIG